MQVRLQQFLVPYTGIIAVDGAGQLTVTDLEALRAGTLEKLVYTATFGEAQDRPLARWVIWEAAAALGIYPESLHALYAARGNGDVLPNFTIPSMNLRVIPFDMARSAFDAAVMLDAGALVFGISRTEIDYTGQRPMEFVIAVLAAAIQAGYAGPVFFQADNMRVYPEPYYDDPEAEIATLQQLILEYFQAGVYNIDLNAAALVRPDKKSVAKQQVQNCEVSAVLTTFIREREPEGVTAAIGGDIGELSQHNTTAEELRAFMDCYQQNLPKDVAGLSKISVQTGTAPGGVMLPDGTFARLPVDFERLRRLSTLARQEYGLAGAVQHGVSTLPEDTFEKFTEAGACEVHLATRFQNVFFEHKALPADLRQAMYAYVDDHCVPRRTPDMTAAQFYYSNRKRALAAFRRETWALPEETRHQFCQIWQEQFSIVFEQFSVTETLALARQYSPGGPRHRDPAAFVLTEDERLP